MEDIRLHTRERLAEMGIDLSAENNNEVHPSVNMEVEHTGRIFHSISGSDIIVKINDVAYGEIQGYNINTINKTIAIDIVHFYKDIEDFNKYKYFPKDSTLTELMMSQNMTVISRTFEGLRYVGETSYKHIDQICVGAKYIYRYESCSDFIVVDSITE
jgi:hypothetical protein